MKTTFNITSRREGILEMQDVENGNVFSYATALMKALRNKLITSPEYTDLCMQLEHFCYKNKISTQIELGNGSLSLFE